MKGNLNYLDIGIMIGLKFMDEVVVQYLEIIDENATPLS